jgi:hypothetical protein
MEDLVGGCCVDLKCDPFYLPGETDYGCVTLVVLDDVTNLTRFCCLRAPPGTAMLFLTVGFGVNWFIF